MKAAETRELVRSIGMPGLTAPSDLTPKPNNVKSTAGISNTLFSGEGIFLDDAKVAHVQQKIRPVKVIHFSVHACTLLPDTIKALGALWESI